jgi:hypothetical protein
MGIVGSDVVAVTCIVAGGVLGGLGWRALEADAPAATPAAECSGVIVTTVSAPDVVVRIGDQESIVIASRSTPGSNVRLACGEVRASLQELRLRTERARVRIGESSRAVRTSERVLRRLEGTSEEAAR